MDGDAGHGWRHRTAISTRAAAVMNEEKSPMPGRDRAFTPTLRSNNASTAALPIIETTPPRHRLSSPPPSSQSQSHSLSAILSPPSRVSVHLSPTEIRELHEAFKAFDRDGLGFIDTASLKTLMQSMGYSKYNNKLIYTMIADLSTPTLSFKDFLSLMDSRPSNDRADIDAVFSLLDDNNDGFIDINDLRVLGRSLYETISERDLASMIECTDLNGDGKISKQEFYTLMTKPVNDD